MPRSPNAPSDPEWEELLIIASYPLRELSPDGRVINTASGCVVEYQGSLLLLTVAHATENEGRWAIELRFDPAKGTQLLQIGAMQFLVEADLVKRQSNRVDLAWACVPPALDARCPVFRQRILIREIPRPVLRTDLNVVPSVGVRYGFAGHVRVDRVDAVDELHADIQLETGLVYQGQHDAFDIYGLDHPHPGHDAYKGCSGAPVLSVDGDLVGLVVGAGENDTIRVLPLRLYRSAIDIGAKDGQLGIADEGAE